jgi:hypothetical protein
MVVIVHETARVKDALQAIDHSLEGREDAQPILVVEEDVRPAFPREAMS